jgi:hypothetical protein
MRKADLPVHRFSPVRTHVIRSGREWVPAVLRYNRIPNRILLEIANLGNDEDRALVVTRRFRQDAAEAIAQGLVDFFGEGEATGARTTLRPVPVATGPALPEPGTVRIEIAGPWPPPREIAGPWREVAGPWPGRDRVARRPIAPPKNVPKIAPKRTPKSAPKIAPKKPKHRR